MKSDLINVSHLKDVLRLAGSTAEESAEAFQKAMQIALEQPLVTYTDPSELLVTAGYPLNSTIITSGTRTSDPINTPSQIIVALQCKSCGGVIDKDIMTCRHCGMTYMLVNSDEINPRYIYPDF